MDSSRIFAHNAMEPDEDGSNQTKRRYVLSRILLILVGLLLGLLCVEAGLRLAEVLGADWLYIASEGLVQYQIPDQKLGLRIEPDAPGHDANGFRNEVVPDFVDIVAIGDSQTWGINARRSQAWPQTLARLSGHSTYNMGLGFYGTVEYWALTEEALQLSPKVVIIGLFPGNDLWGAYNTVYQNDTYSWLRNSQLEDELLHDAILSRTKDVVNEQEEYRSWLERSIFADLGHELNKRSRTLRVVWTSWLTLSNSQYKQAEAWAREYPDEGAVYKKGSISNVLEPGYRLPALDLDEPSVIEGLRITKQMLLLIHTETKAADVKLLLLLIPTQETVYAEAVETLHGHLTPTYTKLVQMEARLRTEIISLCKENDIRYVDVLPSLAEALQRGEEIYPSDPSGHPLPRGYFLIASTVNEALNRLSWFK